MNIVCPKCKNSFDPSNKKITFGAIAAGMAGGAKLGAGVGIVAGPLGGISGIVPGAILGGLASLGLSSNVKMCPNCKKVFIPETSIDPKINHDLTQKVRELETEKFLLIEKYGKTKTLNRIILLLLFLSMAANIYLYIHK